MKDYQFSYEVSGKMIFDQFMLSLDEGSCVLIRGREDKPYVILGAILGKILPCMELPEIESLKLLYQDFYGELKLTKSPEASTVTYLGSDPERHLFFSKIWEEFYTIFEEYGEEDIKSVLGTFSLNADFRDREISTLSGGEKMKFALALTFASDADIIVLHGVVPWLDQLGRNDLLRTIQKAKDEKKIVIIFEQEYLCLSEVVDRLFYLEDCEQSVHRLNRKMMHEDLSRQKGESLANDLKESLKIKITEFNEFFVKDGQKEVIAELRNISFSYPNQQIFKDCSLIIRRNHFYTLLGENGSGKSSLALLLYRQLCAKEGDIILNNQSLTHLKRIQINQNIHYVSQFPEKQMYWNTIGECYQEVAQTGLIFLEKIFKKYFAYPDEYPCIYLSPNELKILLLICGFRKETQLLILDEPTWSLDIDRIEILLDILIEIRNCLNFSVVMITHAQSLLPLFESNLLIIKDHRICENQMERIR